MEFVNILLQTEVKAVKNASSVLLFSGDSELETGLLTGLLRMHGTAHNQKMVSLCISILPFRTHIVTFFFELPFFFIDTQE